MTPRKWSLLAWGVILTVVIGVCAVGGGRHCQVPQSGLFHRLLKGRRFVETHAGRWACQEVK